jgi:hypothetical protein
VAGAIAGGLVFGLFVALGLTLLNRVANNVPVIVLGVAGAYAGWLVGVIVFGSVRGTTDLKDDRNEDDQS